MSEKTLNNIRIVHKHDIEENWLKAINFIPKQGELIIYDVDTEHSYERFKIGDGINLVNDLPFGSIQSDWNENNQDSLKYIYNKPFGEIDNVLYSETLTFTNGECNFMTTENNFDASIYTGDIEYTIRVDDYVFKSYWSSIYLDQVYGFNVYNDNGDHLYLFHGGGTSAIRFYKNGEEIPEVSTAHVTISYPELKQIPIEFIPEHTHTVSNITDYVAPVQSDWNAYDETSMAYIQNRPFYETEYIENVYIPETILSGFTGRFYTGDKVYYQCKMPVDYYVQFDLDKTYTVIWDGVKYDNVTCNNTTNGVAVGSSYRDLAHVDGTPNYPFSIVIKNSDTPELIVSTDSSQSSHTVKVVDILSEAYLKKIDEKFLPDSVLPTSDEEFMDMLMSINALNTVTDSDSSILTDESGNVLIW